MRSPIYCIIALLLCNTARSQQTDSIKYANGYLYYHTYGKGAPVIVLTGGPGNSYRQQEAVAMELGKSYKAILLEQRGTGRSIPAPFDSTTITLESAIADVGRLQDHLQIKQALIYGHSWGAMLAMCYAATHPEKVKALVLVAPGYYKISQELFAVHLANVRSRLGLAELRQLDSLSAKTNRSAEEAAAYDRLVRYGYIYNKYKIDSLLPQINAAPSNATMRDLMIKDLMRSGYDLTARPALSRYKGPIQVISGRQDALAFYTYELKIIHPSMQLHWIQESGHFPMFEQPKAFYDTLSQVLQKL
ncbi:alpha/beta hydrolase [uncultured Chitinophaga sp.]|jgi:Predicted hydrolases or acyltransferases (alpha/beta hydrolase superfamily)|uniref:alpha/beta fold hydrolase n=1 Tax=uncultured Chitinophaga sp. TaxID=339340 RepID=UPI002614DE02|nr:alpha/beta hydrolase [uncultured Chitinophaga sp.]